MKYLFPLLILLLAGCARVPEAIADSAQDGFCAVHPLGGGVAAVREEASGVSVALLDADFAPSQAVLCEGAFLSDCEITPQENSLWIADAALGMGWRIAGDMEISAVSLPSGYRRGIWQGGTLYYTTDDAVRALEGGMVRLIKQMPCREISILPWSEEALALSSLWETTIVSKENGMELDRFPGRLLSSAGDASVFQDGAGQGLVMGSGASVMLTAVSGEVLTFCENGLALIQDDTGLSVLDAKSGTVCMRTAPGEDITHAVLHSDGAILLDARGELNFIPFSQWREESLPVFSDEFATMQNPCTAGREALAQRAASMADKFGIPICINPEAYGLTTECQPLRIAHALDMLEAALTLFPREVFPERMKIALVSANFNPQSDSGGCILRRDDGDIIVLAAGTGREDYALFHHFSHLMDGEVIAACSAFDNWETCNPANFGYGLPGNEGRAEYAGYFPSEKAMQSPGEDRAEIFAAACMSGNADIFRTEAMQNKLLRLCTGIRKVYHLERDTRIFRWEQYLYQTLAPPCYNAG